MLNSKFYGLTGPQKNIWNTELFFNNTTVNNVCVSGIINDVIDFNLLNKAVNLLVKQNDSFRIRLRMEKEEPIQFLSSFKAFDAPIVEVASQEEFVRLEEDVAQIKFKIFDADLFLFRLAKFPDGRGGVVLNVHHLIADSWSLGLTIQEIIKNYYALKNGTDYIPGTFSYIDYIESEANYKNSKKYLSDKKFWSDYLIDVPEPVTIPSNSTNLSSSNGKRISYTLNKDLYKLINSYCKEHNISNYVFFMSVFALYIANVSNSLDFVLGTPILNRTNFKEKSSMGMFVETVPFRFSLDTNLSFSEFVSMNSIGLMSILRHQKYSYTDILEDLRNVDPSIPNLYNIAISYQITKAFSNDIGDYETNWTFNNNCLNDVNIHIYDINDTGSLKIDYDYLTCKYSLEDIYNIHTRVLYMINQILNSGSDLGLKDIKVITEEEKITLDKFNDYSLDYPKICVHQLISNIAKKYPDSTAVVHNGDAISYGELENRSNIIANSLKNLGVVKNDVVSIYMLEKNIDLICSILGVLKSGACFLGIYPEYPIDRIKYMIEDSQAKAVIVNGDSILENINTSLLNLSTLDFSKDEDFVCEDKDINSNAYIIYTSGSTGKPKGVSLSHKNLVNFVYSFKKHLNGVSPKDKFLSVTNICFDVSIAEIFTPLCFGDELHLYKDLNCSQPKELAEYIVKNHITFSYFPPALLSHISDELKKCGKAYLNKMLVGVEPIKASVLGEFLKINPKMRIVNGYGPTETTICCTMYDFNNDLPADSIVPIGGPLHNDKIHILNKFMNYMPIGNIGTLWVSGDGVGNGYIGEAKNSQTSYQDINGTRFYNTGDLAKWDSNGVIHFVGRNDNQIKYRGYRIDLGEIESAIKKYDGVTNCFVLLDKSNTTDKLIGFVCGVQNIEEFSLRGFLSSSLPHYMIPNLFIFLPAFPLTPNGKVDKKKLLEIARETYGNFETYQAPKTDTEKTIASLFSKTLNVSTIGLNSNFFELGGDSLAAIKFIAEVELNLNVKIYMKDIFSFPTVSSLAKYIDSSCDKKDLAVIVKAKKEESYPLSFAQKRIYYTMKLDENSTVYNTPFGITFDKLPDMARLEYCFNTLINRHVSLRTYFELENGEVRQKVLDNVNVNLDIVYEEDKSFEEIFEKFIKPFDLSKAPLFRVKLVKTTAQYILLIDMHHIICDGTSSSIFAEELCKLYNGVSLDSKDLDYTDFAVWENSNSSSQEFENAKKYWMEAFEKGVPELNMPSNYVRPKKQSFEGNKLYAKIDGKNVFEACKTLNTTPYMFLLSIYYVLLYKYTNQESIVVGSPVVGRDNALVSNVIGMFVNTLPLKNDIDKTASFKSFLKNVSKNCISAFENQVYPFDELVRNLNIGKEASSKNPLFDTMFTYQNNGLPKLNLNGFNTDYYIPDNKTAKFDFSLEIVPDGDNLNLSLEYCTKLFDEKYMIRFLNHYINILNYILADGLDAKIESISMLSKNEENMLLNDFNNTQMDYPYDKTITQLFEEQVQKAPHQTAIIFEEKAISYVELNKRANQIARFLRNSGIKPNEIVGIMVNRSFELLACMLGVLKAGGAYLPIDPSYPKERINYILEDSGVSALLTLDSLKDTVSTDKMVVVDFDISDIYTLPDDNLEVINNPSDLAYMIYTSGSTGNPKGVMLTHKNVNNFIAATCEKIKFEGNIVSVTTFCFDIFVLESLLPLQRGITIVLANEQEQNIPKLLNDICVKNNVTMLQTTPARMNLLLSDKNCLDYLKNLKAIMLGGEPFPANLLKELKILTKAKLYNMYGPTETTVWSSIKDLTFADDITIGGPFRNTQFYILDKDKKLLPPYVPGELYIGGDGVGNGYFKREKLTKEKFIPNPYVENDVIYNTGDIGKWTEDGEVICLGRSDFQVKIRGLRIELEEIENRILQFPNIIKAVVCVKKDNLGREFLCSYFVSSEMIRFSNLKDFLKQFLPAYMVPNRFMQISDFTYTPNGKIDKKALPEITLNTEEKAMVLASTETEKKLAKIFEELLGISPISIYDNFFEIGGDSMLALKLQIALMNDNIEITYADIFELNTIKKLAQKIDSHTMSVSKRTEEYDFSKINELLEVNNISSLDDLSGTNHIGNIVLTGATGFLGAHILSYILENTDLKVYCLLRNNPSININTKLLRKLNYYFGNKYDNLLDNRFFAIACDITKENLGLDESYIDLLSKNTSCIINSAAIVKHFGDYADFESVNVAVVRNVVEFCKKYNKKLVQISTTSVSGNTLFDTSKNTSDFNEDIEFNETKLYIGQSLENVYVRSKFEAEKIILENIISHNLDALILRIGNITNRALDGKFQPNSNENAFANRLKAFMELKCIPNYLSDIYAEFSPVDDVAKAVFMSILYAKNINVLHIYNSNHVYMRELISMLPDGLVEFVDNDVFDKKLESFISSGESTNEISSLINDIDGQKHLSYDNKIKIKNNFSNLFLEKIGFKWSDIDKDYINKLLKNL